MILIVAHHYVVNSGLLELIKADGAIPHLHQQAYFPAEHFLVLVLLPLLLQAFYPPPGQQIGTHLLLHGLEAVIPQGIGQADHRGLTDAGGYGNLNCGKHGGALQVAEQVIRHLFL